jgi:hypothetical protein
MLKIFGLAITVLLCVSASVYSAPDCTPKPPPRQLIEGGYPSQSLECLIIEAKQIVVGEMWRDKRVSEIIRISGYDITTDVRLRTLRSVQILKPATAPLAESETFNLREFFGATLGVPIGLKVLLFLGDPLRETNFDHALHKYAGFWIEYDFGGEHGQMQSAEGNEKLWGNQLWSPTLLREKVAKYLPEDRREKLLKIGDGPAADRSLPLELVIAVIRAKVN